MEEILKLLAAAGAGGGFAYAVKLLNDWWKHKETSKEQETKLSLEESKEYQKLDQDEESYNLKQMKEFQKERQRIHEKDMEERDARAKADKEEVLAQLGQYAKKLDECEKGHAWGRIIIVRMIEFMRQKYSITTEEEEAFFRPVETWEKKQDEKRVEDAKKKENGSVH
jgi:hypothetical protein